MIAVLLLLLLLVTLVHEVGHALAVRLKGGELRRLQVGAGPVVYRGAAGGAELLLRALPIGGRIDYDGVAPGLPRVMVAVGGSAANFLVAVLAFALASPTALTPLRTAGAWFWLVPEAVGALLLRGPVWEMRRAVQELPPFLAEGTLSGTLFVFGALSALWAALNLIPLPGLRTDGWLAVTALWSAMGVRASPDPGESA